MTWKAVASIYDEETIDLLSLAVFYLQRFFGHTQEHADRIVEQYLTDHGAFYEDYFHHEGPYRVAAAAHYLVSLGGTREQLMDWLRQSGHQTPPHEALEYLREHLRRLSGG